MDTQNSDTILNNRHQRTCKTATKSKLTNTCEDVGEEREGSQSTQVSHQTIRNEQHTHTQLIDPHINVTPGVFIHHLQPETKHRAQCYRMKYSFTTYREKQNTEHNATEWSIHPPPTARNNTEHNATEWSIHPPPTDRNKTQSTMLQNEVFIHHLQRETKHRAQCYRMKYSFTTYREKQNTEHNATEWSIHPPPTERNKTQSTMLQNEVFIHHLQRETKHRAQCYRMKYSSTTYREKQNTEHNATEWSIHPPHTERNKTQSTMLQNEVFIHHIQWEKKHRAQCYRMKYSSTTYSEKQNTEHNATEWSIHPPHTERNKTQSTMLQNEAFIHHIQRETKHRAQCYRMKHSSTTYSEKKNTEHNATEWSIHPLPTDRNKTQSKMLQNKVVIHPQPTKHTGFKLFFFKNIPLLPSGCQNMTQSAGLPASVHPWLKPGVHHVHTPLTLSHSPKVKPSFFHIVSSFNILKSLTLSEHAGLFCVSRIHQQTNIWNKKDCYHSKTRSKHMKRSKEPGFVTQK